MKNLAFLLMILSAQFLFSQSKIAECSFTDSKIVTNKCVLTNPEHQNLIQEKKLLKINFSEKNNDVIFKINVNHYEDLKLIFDFAEKPSDLKLFLSSNQKTWKEAELKVLKTDDEVYQYFSIFDNKKKWLFIKLQSNQVSEVLLKSITIYSECEHEIAVPLPD